MRSTTNPVKLDAGPVLRGLLKRSANRSDVFRALLVEEIRRRLFDVLFRLCMKRCKPFRIGSTNGKHEWVHSAQKSCYDRKALIKINSSTGLPVYLQIIEQVKHLIETGVLRPGDALPSVRNLATQLVISPNTVIKAYTELEHQNVIDLRMGSGAYVRTQWVSTEKPERMRAASANVRETVAKLKGEGFTQEEIRRMFEAELNATAETHAATAVSAASSD